MTHLTHPLRGLALALAFVFAMPLVADAQEREVIWGRLTYDYCDASWYTNRDITDESSIVAGYRTQYNASGLITRYERVTNLDRANEAGLCLREDDEYCVNAEMTARYDGGRLTLMRIQSGDGSERSEARFTYDGSRLTQVEINEPQQNLRTVHTYDTNRIRTRTEQFQNGELMRRDDFYPFCGAIDQPQRFRRTETYLDGVVQDVREYDERENIIVLEYYDSGRLHTRVENTINARGHWVEQRLFRLDSAGNREHYETVTPIFDSNGVLVRRRHETPDGELIGEVEVR